MDTITQKKRRAPGAGSKPGERRGGRRPGSISRTTWSLLQRSEEMGSDPLEALLTVVGSDAIRVPQIDPASGKQAIDEWGECLFTWFAVSTAERISACKSVLGYLFPKLAAQTVTGPNDGPVQVATLDVMEILSNPALAKEAQRIALMLADQMDPNAPSSAPAVPYDTRLVPIKKNRYD